MNILRNSSSSNIVIAIQLQNEPISNNTGVNAKKHPLASERRLENMNMVQEDTHKLERSSYVSSTDVSPVIRSLVNGHASNSPNRNSLSIQKLAASPSADSSSPSSVCDNLDINPRSMTRSSGHESLGQSFHEKLANYRNIVADVQRNSNESTFGIYSKHTSSQDRGHFTSKNPGYENFDTTKCDDKLNGRCKEADKYFMKERSNLDGNERSNLDGQNYIEDEQLVAQEARDQALLGSNTHSYGESNTSMQENILKSERLKNTKSVRLPGDSVRNAELNENGILGDAQNSSGNRSNDRRDSKILAKEIRSGTLDGKIEHLDRKSVV